MIATSIRGPRWERVVFFSVVALMLGPARGHAAPFNIAPDGEVIFGAGVDIFGTDDLDLGHFGPFHQLNDEIYDTGPMSLAPNGYSIGPATNGSDTCCDTARLMDYVGVIFPGPVSGVNSIKVQHFIANDGGWWGPADNVAGGAPLTADEIAPPQIQVTTDRGATWTNIATTSTDYVEQVTGTIRGTGFPFATRTPFATFNFATQNGIDGIRLIGDGAGAAGSATGFIGVTELLIFQEQGVVFPTLDIDTSTGAMTLLTGAGTPRGIQGYSISSSPDVGALDPSGWLSVADNYDQGNPGPNQIDPNHPWTKLSASTSRTLLSEAELSAGSGGTLGSNLALPLGDVWIPNPFGNDIIMEILLPDGRVRRVDVTYDGLSDNPFQPGDVNFDGVINHLDWPIIRDNFNSSLAAMSRAEAYGFGDLNGDGVNDMQDIAMFKALFDAANGAGAFQAMLAGSVPEPSSLTLAALLIGGLAIGRRRTAAVR